MATTTGTKKKDFLTIGQLSTEEIHDWLKEALALKKSA